MSKGPRSAPPELPGFTADRWIGGGGFADVFLYTQLRPSRSVAVKILRSEHLSAQALAQFDAEADIMAEVSTHPYIVTIFSSGVSPDGRPYIVMEHYPRPNFGDRAKGGKLDLAEVLRTGIQVASAVETAHRAGIIHRDIKPANILTSAFDRPGLTDFGISGVQSEGVISEAVGITVAYTAPELLSEESAGSVATDVYGLGATVSALASGHSPFWSPTGDNGGQAILARALAGSPLPLTRPGIPNSLNNLLTHTMDPNPAHRPASAVAFAQALQQIEQELRLQPTPIEVAPTAGDGRGAGPDKPDDDDRTRRSIQVVDPQPTPASNPYTTNPTNPTAPTAPTAPAAPPTAIPTPPGAAPVPIVAASSAPVAPPPTSPVSATPPVTAAPGPSAFAPPTSTPYTSTPRTVTPAPSATPPASRVPSVSTTPSWARSAPDVEDAETVARRRPDAEGPTPFRPTASPSPTASSPTPAATATSASRALGAPPPLDEAEAKRPVPERPKRQLPWKSIGIAAAVVAALGLLVVVLTSTTGRSSKAGPGSDTTVSGPIQSIDTGDNTGPAITPANPTFSAFTVTGDTATAKVTWTPPSDYKDITVDVIPMGSETPIEVDGPTNGKLPISLHMAPDGSCTTATVGTKSVPCTTGPPCVRITGTPTGRTMGDPAIAQYPYDQAEKVILNTGKLHYTAAEYSQSCLTAFGGTD